MARFASGALASPPLVLKEIPKLGSFLVLWLDGRFPNATAGFLAGAGAAFFAGADALVGYCFTGATVLDLGAALAEAWAVTFNGDCKTLAARVARLVLGLA